MIFKKGMCPPCSFKFSAEASSVPSREKLREAEQDWDTDSWRGWGEGSTPDACWPWSLSSQGCQPRCPTGVSTSLSPAVPGQPLRMSDPQAGRKGAGSRHLPERRLPRPKAKLQKQVAASQLVCYYLFFRKHVTKSHLQDTHTHTYTKAQSDLTTQPQGSGPASCTKTEGLRTGAKTRRWKSFRILKITHEKRMHRRFQLCEKVHRHIHM